MRNRCLFIALALGLGLASALLWLLSNSSTSAIAAPARREQQAQGDVITVCLSGGCDYNTVQDAVDAASDGDVIRVAEGIYTDISARKGVTQVVYISKSVTIQGGYATTNGLAGPPDPVANPTTLDAQGQGRVFYITGDISLTVEGLHVTGGDADQGAGMWGANANVTLQGSWVVSNTADNHGGGLELRYGHVTLVNNVIAHNTSGGDGGGVFLKSNENVTVINNVISQNIAGLTTGGQGGGLVLVDEHAEIHSNTIVSNTSTHGGGVFLRFGKATLVNNVIARNSAPNGNAIYIYGALVNLLHNTIAHNVSAHEYGIYLAPYQSISSVATMTNTILVGHVTGIYVNSGCTATLNGTLWDNQSDWGGAGTVITGMVNVRGDPAFVDPGTGDYHIGLDSAARNTGVDAGVTLDIDGDPRPQGSGHDLGADETGLIVTKRADPDPVSPGGQLTFTIQVTNTSDVDMHAIVVDTLPAHVTPRGVIIWPTQNGLATEGGPTTILRDQAWMPVSITSRGIWTRQFTVAVDAGYTGPLTNVVQVFTFEGAAGSASVTVSASGHRICLPLVLRDF